MDMMREVHGMNKCMLDFRCTEETFKGSALPF